MAYAAPVTFDPTNVMGRRITAFFIDVVAVIFLAALMYVVVFVSAGSTTQGSSCSAAAVSSPHAEVCVKFGSTYYVGERSRLDNARVLSRGVLLLGLANILVLQGLVGATLGKLMLGLRVVRADGTRAGFGWNALRTLLLLIDALPYALFLPGLLTAALTHPHRRIGDFAAGTFVVARDWVGHPIGAPMSAGAYPPPWSPPAGGWGPPPGGGPTWGAPTPTPGWGAPNPAPSQGWGAPPAHNPTPAQSPPAAEPPRTWGAPPPSEPAADAPGWAAPTPAAEPQPQAQPQGQPQGQPPPARREPQWDPQRNAWVYWEAETNRWLQHDPQTNTWGPLS